MQKWDMNWTTTFNFGRRGAVLRAFFETFLVDFCLEEGKTPSLKLTASLPLRLLLFSFRWGAGVHFYYPFLRKINGFFKMCNEIIWVLDR